MANVTPIRKILIANRGEIARRIIRTAKDMGIATVAIYSDSDANAPFVLEADTAIALTGTTPAETYLDTEKVLEACRMSGADALHPGYGFLSENTGFAQAIQAAGMIFIGPSTTAIDQMGDKLSAKALMQAAGVPTLPAIALTGAEDLAAAGESIGYPVLVKASAGGGGRGMRVVETPEALEAAVASARREAGSAFGDDTVFLERWLSTSRHVEIQVLGDQLGHVVHCFERECSIQRRHQKIIEEAPSPAVTETLRAAMGNAAVAAAKAIGYYSAGTVEFLLAGDEFFFLEVNTRLQVEHPITEEITGLDLVREQIRVAEGHALEFTQDDLSISGHAIEARIYAENPARDFLPAPGTIKAWQPSNVAKARFDSGIEAGSIIGTQFDPMIAKVIVHAKTRAEAISRLARVLETTRIQGLTTNRDFLVATLRTQAFLDGDTTTDFIERVNPAREKVASIEHLQQAAIAAAVELRARRHKQAQVLKGIPRGWRNSHLPPQRTSFKHQAVELNLEYRTERDQTLRFSIDDETFHCQIYQAGEGLVDCRIGTQRLRFQVDASDNEMLIHGPEGDITLEYQSRFPRKDSGDLSGGLTAPMPGKVLAVKTTNNATVSKGDTLLILEAMKMEHQILAPRDGVIASVKVLEGDQVGNGELLIEMRDDDPVGDA
ncbi:MAG: propionyl-CoA carboxylase alpha chain [Candidatus Azotimanducaceae bacterium]|jgi:propionyl-CoA carboxylase alpha chain